MTTVPERERCSFYRASEGIGLGRGIGHCDLDGGQTVCDGDLNFCEKPSDLKKYQSKETDGRKDRRQYPRFLLDLPLEYLVTNAPKAHGGLVVNVSEIGLLIRSVKNMAIHVRILRFGPAIAGFDAGRGPVEDRQDVRLCRS